MVIFHCYVSSPEGIPGEFGRSDLAASGWDVVGFDGVEPIDVALAAMKNAGGNPQVTIFHVYLYPPNVCTGTGTLW